MAHRGEPSDSFITGFENHRELAAFLLGFTHGFDLGRVGPRLIWLPAMEFAGRLLSGEKLSDADLERFGDLGSQLTHIIALEALGKEAG